MVVPVTLTVTGVTVGPVLIPEIVIFGPNSPTVKSRVECFVVTDGLSCRAVINKKSAVTGTYTGYRNLQIAGLFDRKALGNEKPHWNPYDYN